jgi:hypothetical protein
VNPESDSNVRIYPLEAQTIRPGETEENRSFVITPVLRLALSQAQLSEVT